MLRPCPTWVVALGLALALLTGATRVRAESAAVLPVRESARVDERVRRDAATALVAALAAEGVRVRSPADTEAALVGDPLAACAGLDCAGGVARRLGVDVVVVLSVFGTALRAESVTVALATADGLSFGGEADVDAEHPVDRAVTAALAEARIRLGAGTRGTLRVETTPPGATVHIDGEFRGETPVFRAIEPGAHRVVVSQPGRVSETRDVVVQLHEETAIALTLAPVTVPVAAPREVPASRPWLGPLVLGGAGAALLAFDLASLVTIGCSEEAPGGACRREIVVDPLPFGLYAGLGGGALVGALLWWLLGGEAPDEAPPTSARLRLDVGLGDVTLRGRF
jgi:hypothetical protein